MKNKKAPMQSKLPKITDENLTEVARYYQFHRELNTALKLHLENISLRRKIKYYEDSESENGDAISLYTIPESIAVENEQDETNNEFRDAIDDTQSAKSMSEKIKDGKALLFG